MVRNNGQLSSIISNCETCVFFNPNMDKHGSQGECRYEPPKIFAFNQASQFGPGKTVLQALYPVVPASSWCGCFTPHPGMENNP